MSCQTRKLTQLRYSGTLEWQLLKPNVSELLDQTVGRLQFACKAFTFYFKQRN